MDGEKMELILAVGKNIKSLLRNTALWVTIIIFMQIVIIWLILYVYLEICDRQYHFYMNTKASLEAIHNIELDKYDGKFPRKLSTEEQLIRKNNERFHLWMLFK